MVKKSYTISCGNRCPEILEKISEEVPGIYSATVEGGVIRITFDDSHIGAREAVELIKESTRGFYPSRGGATGSLARFSLRYIQKRIGGPVYIEPLLDLLRLRGRRASPLGSYIETDASIEEIIDLAMALSKCANEAPKDLLTPRARRVVIALCADSDASAEHVIGFLESKGVLFRGSDGRLDTSNNLDEIKNLL